MRGNLRLPLLVAALALLAATIGFDALAGAAGSDRQATAAVAGTPPAPEAKTAEGTALGMSLSLLDESQSQQSTTFLPLAALLLGGGWLGLRKRRTDRHTEVPRLDSLAGPSGRRRARRFYARRVARFCARLANEDEERADGRGPDSRRRCGGHGPRDDAGAGRAHRHHCRARCPADPQGPRRGLGQMGAPGGQPVPPAPPLHGALPRDPRRGPARRCRRHRARRRRAR